MPSLYDDSMQYGGSNSGGNGMAIDPVTGQVITGLGNAIMSGFSGGEKPTDSQIGLVNQGQQALWNQMARGVMGGQGDFGFGTNVKQGKSQLQDFMASRGVKMDPSSGSYAGAMGNMIGQAQGMDQGARRGFAMDLLRSPMQTFQGPFTANMLPGSPSRGSNWNSQEANWRNRNRDTEGGITALNRGYA